MIVNQCPNKLQKQKYLQKRQVSLKSVLFHWGILLHVSILSLLKLLRERKKHTYFIHTDDKGNTIIIYFSILQLTSNCAELTKLVLGSNFEAIFQSSDLGLIFFMTIHRCKHWLGDPRQGCRERDVWVSTTTTVLSVSCNPKP